MSDRIPPETVNKFEEEKNYFQTIFFEDLQDTLDERSEGEAKMIQQSHTKQKPIEIRRL